MYRMILVVISTLAFRTCTNAKYQYCYRDSRIHVIVS